MARSRFPVAQELIGLQAKYSWKLPASSLSFTSLSFILYSLFFQLFLRVSTNRGLDSTGKKIKYYAIKYYEIVVRSIVGSRLTDLTYQLI